VSATAGLVSGVGINVIIVYLRYADGPFSELTERSCYCRVAVVCQLPVASRPVVCQLPVASRPVVCQLPTVAET
jgi:hypothetical protein